MEKAFDILENLQERQSVNPELIEKAYTCLKNAGVRKSMLLFLSLRGSQTYGTSTPTSDSDYVGIYAQDPLDISCQGYVAQVQDAKGDFVMYEIQRYFELLQSSNPGMLEIAFMPSDCIVYRHRWFAEFLSATGKHNEEFSKALLSKKCRDSFGGYAVAQIKKAKGQDKKNNWEKSRVTRKTPLDFCYLLRREATELASLTLSGYDLEKFTQSTSLKELIEQKPNWQFGLCKVDHARDVYALYASLSIDLGDICVEDSNELRLMEIPKDPETRRFIRFAGYVSYNQDGYSKHCKDYREYQDWLKNRNENRWVDVENHGQKIDGKNMMHCRRLLDMALEIAQGKGLQVRRPNAEYLLDIRYGKVSLEDLINQAEEDIASLDELYASSSLPDKVDSKVIQKRLVSLRKELMSTSDFFTN